MSNFSVASSSRTTATCPYAAAIHSGVWPFHKLANCFSSPAAPVASSNWTTAS
ncbi:hypothetical protein BKA56DRAFT_590170 [Ilyonectria sp. MPI-CAGE-AT-0026]|nr:hypothetical protein BKA56DRAFT_590170 [Ilyonectria sp. MPI-CAGE-AT-0026]